MGRRGLTFRDDPVCFLVLQSIEPSVVGHRIDALI